MRKFSYTNFVMFSCTLTTLFVFSGCSKRINPDRTVWPIAYYPTQYRVPIQKAYVISKKNTFNGFIKLINRDFYPMIPDNRVWIPESVINVKIDDILYMRLMDSVKGKNVISEYVRVDKDHLYRLLANKNDFRIFDDDLRMGWFRHEMILITPRVTISLYTYTDYHVHFGNIRPLLLKFIKKRYNLSPSESGFKTDKDILNYILDQEINKETSTQL